MIPVVNNFPKEYDGILDGLENCLVASEDNALTIEVIREKLNCWYNISKEKMKKKEKEKRC